MGTLGNVEHSLEIDGKTLTFEGGKLAQQAGGSVVTSMGDSTILTTTTAGAPKEFLGFFPLTIEVEERMYAAGRIPGSFFKREGRPSENAILTARLTDRPLRPTFAEGLRNEIQVVNTILQTTKHDPYDVVAMNGSSVATMLAGVPFDGPIGATRYAMMRDGSWIAFPSFEELEEEAVFNMVVAGRVADDGEVAILMIEAEATPDSWVKIDMGAEKPTEEVIGRAIEDVKPIIRQLCEAQNAFIEKIGRREIADLPRFPEYSDEVHELVDAKSRDAIKDLYHSSDLKKSERGERMSELRSEAVEHVLANGPEDLDDETRTKQAKNAFRSVEKSVVRKLIAEEGIRIDGRGTSDLRALTAEVGVLPSTHGTGLFSRGETQVLSVLALGTTREAQRLDTLDPQDEKTYLHHYNFPPYSTGETGRIGSPKRREIGHGLLAERALVPVLPSQDEWPYVMRIVSDVMSSNGSTSMASVCGSTLALMDGGVPIHAPVAGIAMGLIKEGDTYTTLTDIQGTEDFFGDMDFKVAGTPDFVTALQLDTKLSGVPSEVLSEALMQAREARVEILAVMNSAISEPRDEVAATAPRVELISIPKDKIGDVIGPRGAVIREITEETGAEIDIDEEAGRGMVRIYASNAEIADAARDRVNAIANPTIPEVGERYHATVVKTVDFGAFVSLTPGIDGLLHISEMSKMAGKRLDHGEEAVDVGDKVWVEIKDVLDGGRKFKLEYVGDEPSPASGGTGGGDGGATSDVTDEADSDTDDSRADDSGADENAADDDTSSDDRRSSGGRTRARRDSGGGGRDRGSSDPDTSGNGGDDRVRTRTRSRSRERE